MEDNLETQTPKPEEETPSKSQIGEGDTLETPGEKTPEQMQKEIDSLYASKKWEREKRKEAEERALRAEEELARLKQQMLSTPSEEELSRKFPDWELYDEGTREIYRKITALEREIFNLKVEKAKAEAKAKWEEDFNRIVSKNPELKSHKEEFREFASREQYENVPLPVLAELFLAKLPKERNEEIPKPGLEKSTGGEKITPPKMTLEEIARLRTKNPKLYFKLIREKRLKDFPEE